MNPRPWPVVLLSALGAWLAAIPFFAVATLLLGPLLHEREIALVTGVFMLGGAIALLRASHRSPFLEQLGVPTLLAGLALFGWGLSKALSEGHLCGVLGLLSLLLACCVPQAWVRAFLGAIAPPLLLMALNTGARWGGDQHRLSFWVSLHGLVVVWLGAVAVPLTWRATPPSVLRVLEDAGHGWIASTLLALAWWSGSTFLLSEPLKLHGAHAAHGLQAAWQIKGLHLGSLSAALLAAMWLAWRWPSWRQPWCAGLATVACVLAAFMPALGGVLLVASACLTTGRTRMATGVGLVALWVVGAFYHQLAWPLATKALVLVAAGLLLGLLAAWGHLANAHTDAATLARPRPAQGERAWGLALALLATLLAANVGIWKSETLIRDGRPIFVALAPVDPRSLMQGDYMALRFDTGPWSTTSQPDTSPIRLVFQVDQRGVATALRQHQGETLQSNELVVRLVRKRGDWQLVTDAYYFKEGEAARWSRARYAEFRVDAGGRALLVGLRGDQLEQL
ncbi:MAG: hypothetical protein RI907_1407 [Pseudomonadota bacterium]|jgi:uncharacterized membrane-anchored protein